MSSPSTGPQPWTSEPDLGASAENFEVITEASTGTQKAGSEPNAGLPRSGQAGSPEATRARAGAMALVGVEPLFPGLVQAFVLFFLEAMSVALGLWSLLHFDALRAYLTQNQLPRAARNVLLMQMIGAGVGVCAVAGVWLAWRGFEKTRSLKAGAWRWSPLIVAGGLPMLFHWQFWSDRPLVFLALAAAVVLGLRRLLAASMSVSAEIPGFLRELAEAWVVMARKHVSRRWRRALPTAVAFAAAAGYSVYFAHHTIVNHFRLGTSAFDLALEDNLVWNLLHGNTPFKSSPLGGPDSVHFGFHATVFAYLLVPFYALYQHAETLLLIQAVLIGFAALPLYWFSRDLIGAWPAALLSVVYAVHPAVQSSNLYDFHYTPLAPFFIYLALYALQAKRDILAAVAIALTLSIREDVSASIVIVGAYFFFWGGRPRAGMSVACAGLLYFVALKFFIMPQFGHGETFLYMYKDLVPGQENGFGPVLKTIIGNPAFTLSTLLTEKKLICVLQILVPFAFLPLKRAVGWFLCLPGFFFNLLTTSYDPPITLGFQYAAHWNSFLFAAIAIVLAQEQRPRHPWDVLGGIRKRSWLAAILAGTLVVSYQFGIFFQHHVARAAFDEVHIGFSDAQRERLKTLREIIRLIPPAAKVVASERLLPHLSNRPDAYRLLHAVYDAEYILVDTPNLGREERDHVQDELRRRQFGVILIRGDFMLARRGAPTEKNAEWLQGGHPFARSRRDRGNRR